MRRHRLIRCPHARALRYRGARFFMFDRFDLRIGKTILTEAKLASSSIEVEYKKKNRTPLINC